MARTAWFNPSIMEGARRLTALCGAAFITAEVYPQSIKKGARCRWKIENVASLAMLRRHSYYAAGGVAGCFVENIQMSSTAFSKAKGGNTGLPAPDQVWKLYCIEAFLLGCFMISATGATILMESPKSIISYLVVSPFLRRVVIGSAMGLTAVLLIYCPWGKRSGAHMNPAFTLSFLRLGKIKPRDALGYMVGQFVGGATGMMLAGFMFGPVVAAPPVHFIATIPGTDGVAAAWGGECVISFILVATVLLVNRFPVLVTRTGLFCGALIALFVIFEAPLSGFSMNPARTFGSAIVGNIWTAWWIYFTAPVVGMLGAVEVHHLLTDDLSKLCLRLNHSKTYPTLHPCECRNPTDGALESESLQK